MVLLNIITKIAIFTISISTISYGGNSFYVDPVNGSDSNDGSFERPWKKLQTVISSGFISSRKPATSPYKESTQLVARSEKGPVKHNNGDTIYLLSGNHGRISLTGGYQNEEFITIKALKGHTPVLNSVIFSACSKWKLSGVNIEPIDSGTVQYKRLLTIESHNWWGPSREIYIENCKIISSHENPINWSKEEWKAKAWTGIYLVGAKQVYILNNELMNVNHGMNIISDSCTIKGNTITNFSHDGMQGIGSYLTFEGNIIKNNFKVNNNHNDGFQSWSVGGDSKLVGMGVVKGLKLIGNTFIARTFDAPYFESELQGIGCFDGFYEDAEVINNLVIANHYHGINFSGVKNIKIINNTVMPMDSVSTAPHIRVGDHKNKSKSEKCIVFNNIASRYIFDQSDKDSCFNNLLVEKTNASNYFQDWKKHDFRLKPNTQAVNSGIERYAPEKDILGNSRAKDFISLGAFQFIGTPAKVAKPIKLHIIRK